MSIRTPESILVIDDDTVFRRRLARAFSDRGFSVAEASNGSEALDCLEQERVSLVVLDLKLEKESGLLILRQLREIDDSIRVVVLTGYGTITTAVDAVKAGAVNYLTKPVDADTVLRAFYPPREQKSDHVDTPHLAQVEWEHIQRVMKDCDGNVTQASKALGLHRRSLQRKLSKNPKQLL